MGVSMGRVSLASNVGAVATTSLEVRGGKYLFVVHAGTWGGGNVVLQTLAGDGSTYVALSTATASSAAVVDLPHGRYRVNVTTSTGVYADLFHIPSS